MTRNWSASTRAVHSRASAGMPNPRPSAAIAAGFSSSVIRRYATRSPPDPRDTPLGFPGPLLKRLSRSRAPGLRPRVQRLQELQVLRREAIDQAEPGEVAWFGIAGEHRGQTAGGGAGG